MRRIWFWLIILAVVPTLGLGSRERAARLLASFPVTGVMRLVWIAAHPDDEVLIAPLLGELCIDRGIRCSFLILTRGEGGQCLLPDGCLPDLPTVRIREMQAAAALYRADLEIWELSDGTPGGAAAAREKWAAESGGDGVLVSRVGEYIDRMRGDLLLAFDPRHGSTCHTDHQAAGELALDALRVSRPIQNVYLLETRVRVENAGRSIVFAAAPIVGTVTFDSSRALPSISGPAWDYLLRNAELHASQFDQRRLAAMAAVPRADRSLFFLRFRDPKQLTAGNFCD